MDLGSEEKQGPRDRKRAPPAAEQPAPAEESEHRTEAPHRQPVEFVGRPRQVLEGRLEGHGEPRDDRHLEKRSRPESPQGKRPPRGREPAQEEERSGLEPQHVVSREAGRERRARRREEPEEPVQRAERGVAASPGEDPRTQEDQRGAAGDRQSRRGPHLGPLPPHGHDPAHEGHRGAQVSERGGGQGRATHPGRPELLRGADRLRLVGGDQAALDPRGQSPLQIPHGRHAIPGLLGGQSGAHPKIANASLLSYKCVRQFTDVHHRSCRQASPRPLKTFLHPCCSLLGDAPVTPSGAYSMSSAAIVSAR